MGNNICGFSVEFLFSWRAINCSSELFPMIRVFREEKDERSEEVLNGLYESKWSSVVFERSSRESLSKITANRFELEVYFWASSISIEY